MEGSVSGGKNMEDSVIRLLAGLLFSGSPVKQVSTVQYILELKRRHGDCFSGKQGGSTNENGNEQAANR